MKKVLVVLCLLATATPVHAQKLPPATEEGKKAALELLNGAVKAGAIKFVKDPSTSKQRGVVADEARLKEVARQHRKQFTPAVRDALLGYWGHPGAVALLLRLGEEAEDERAIAFGHFWSAWLLEERLAYQEARQSYEQAAQRFERLKLTEWNTTSLNNLAEVCRAQGDLPRARQLHEQALALRKQLFGERHPAVANSLNNLALVSHDQGDLPHARQLFEQALVLRKQMHGERHPDVASSLNNLAAVCHDQGDLPQARRLHEQALALRKQLHGESHPDVADSLNNLAEICHAQGDLPRARKLHEQALALNKQLHGDRHPAVAASLNNLAAVCHVQGDFPRARKLHEQVIALLRQLHGERHPAVALSLNNLASVCHAQGDLPQARKLTEQALALRKQLHGERHPAVANSFNNLAEVCHAQGDLPQARKLHEQALALLRQLHGERHPAVALSLNNLAGICREEGDRPALLRYRTEAVLACLVPGVERDRLADLRPGDFAATADSVLLLRRLAPELASVESKPSLDRLRQASHAYALAAAVLDRFRTAEATSEGGKLDQGARFAALVPARIALAAALFHQSGKAEDLHAAFAALEQGRGRVFLEALGRAHAHQIGGVPNKLRAEEFDLLSHLRGLDAAIARENAKTLDQRNADLVKQLYEQREKKQQELDALAARLRRDYPQYAALQYPKPCTLAEARACLAENEVAVLFAVDRDASYAVIVHKKPLPGDKGEGVAVVRLPGGDVLGPLVATLTDEAVLKSDSRCRKLGAELYALLLKPLEPHIKGKELVLAPDGILWTLPFELLVEGRTEEDDGKYLAQTRRMRYTPSMTVLHLGNLWEKSRKSPTESLWALGDPVFSKDDPRARGDVHQQTRDLLARYARRGGSGPDWKRLPATGVEVQAIARLHDAGKDVVTDVAASEAVVKAASAQGVLARKRYVHLATHGWLGSGVGRLPSLVLSLVGNDGKEELGGVNEGYLTMQEVTHLKLNADLVVLSACQTGKGTLIPAEGVVGLTRSFLHAGSRGVVCSLWYVEDEGTAELMTAMYRELQKGKSSAEALALARRKLIDEERPPFTWAPFILIGR